MSERQTLSRYVAGVTILVVIVALVVVLAGCGSDYSGPTCNPHKDKHCEAASNNGHVVYVPYWYFNSLRQAQKTSGRPDVNGNQPSESQVKASGGTPDEFHSVTPDAAPSESAHPSAPVEAHPVAVGGE